MISKLQMYSSRVALAQRNPMAARRLFSTATTSSSYESFDDNIFYTPVRKVNFVNGRSIIYHQP